MKNSVAQDGLSKMETILISILQTEIMELSAQVIRLKDERNILSFRRERGRDIKKLGSGEEKRFFKSVVSGTFDVPT